MGGGGDAGEPDFYQQRSVGTFKGPVFKTCLDLRRQHNILHINTLIKVDTCKTIKVIWFPKIKVVF